MKKTFFLIAILTSFITFSQEKNFIDKPYLEVQGKADTLVTPNRIYIDVLISEKDVKGKKSVEELENDMLTKLKSLGIDVDKNVAMQDMMSNYKKFFLKQTDIQKSKSYSILVYDAKTTAKVFIGLEEVGLSNVRIDKLEHSEEKNHQSQSHCFQSRMIFPDAPLAISSNPSKNFSAGNRCVITGLMSKPDCSITVILYQVSYISRP